MCPPACLRVGRAPNHWHVRKATAHASGCVMLWPCILGCVCVGAVCTRVLGQAHLALHSGASRSWALPAGLPGRSSSPPSGPFLARRPPRVSIPSFQVSSDPGEDQTSRCPK